MSVATQRACRKTRTRFEAISDVKKRKNQIVDPELSAEFVGLLVKKGFSVPQIASFLDGKDEAFVSAVAQQKQSLTISDLRKLEKAAKLPMSLLLMHSMKPNGLPPEKRSVFQKFHGAAVKLLESTAGLREFTRRHI